MKIVIIIMVGILGGIVAFNQKNISNKKAVNPRDTITIEHFEEKNVIHNSEYVLIKFHKIGCPYCEKMEPLDKEIIEKYSAAQENPITFIKVTITASTPNYDNLKAKFGIITFPTYVFYKKGIEMKELRSPSMTREVYEKKIKTFQT